MDGLQNGFERIQDRARDEDNVGNYFEQVPEIELQYTASGKSEAWTVFRIEKSSPPLKKKL